MSMRVALLGPMVLLVALAPSIACADGESDAMDKARAYIADLSSGKYDACVAAGSDKMQAALPASKLEMVWGQLTTAFGAYQSDISGDSTHVGNAYIVNIDMRFERGRLRAQVTLGENGIVEGIFFKPIADEFKYEPPAYVDQDKFHEETVTFGAKGFELPGTITLPEGDGPFPGVVLVHGSGPHDEDSTIGQNKPFRDIAWGLASRGIAVLRYEKRTHKYGGVMKAATVTLDTEVTDDAIAGAKLLVDHAKVKDDGVYVVGHSLGATAAPYIGLHAPFAAGVVALCPAGRPLYELILDQVGYIANLDGEIDEEEKASLAAIRATVHKIRTGKTEPGDLLINLPVRYWIDLDRADPLENAKKYGKPILAVFGGRDYQITERESALWAASLKGKDNAKVEIIDGLDHLLRKGEGISKPEDYQAAGQVDESVIQVVSDWIKSQD